MNNCVFAQSMDNYGYQLALQAAAASARRFHSFCIKPVLNWANVCSPEHTSDTSTSYDSFLN